MCAHAQRREKYFYTLSEYSTVRDELQAFLDKREIFDPELPKQGHAVETRTKEVVGCCQEEQSTKWVVCKPSPLKSGRCIARRFYNMDDYACRSLVGIGICMILCKHWFLT